MKVWTKLLVGSLLGFLLGWFLPYDNETIGAVLSWFAHMGVKIGRYMMVPMLIFSLTIAVYELRQDGLFWRLVFRTFFVMILTAFFVVLTGIAVIYLAPTIRIPILTGEQVPMVSMNPLENISDLFPVNILATDGAYFFPLCVFAFFLGMGLSYDRTFTKPVITLIDSLSHIFYYIGSFFAEILGLVMITLSAYWAVRYHQALQEDLFQSVMALLAILSGVLGFVALPVFFCFFGGKRNPWIVLRGALGPALTGFFSGDITFAIPVVIHHAKEHLGVRRRVNAITIPLLTTFGRSGSAMVAAITLVVVIQSYSSLKLDLFPDILIIGFEGVVLSLLLARYPGDGAYTALAALCIHYGKGFEAGYLILKPLAFYLIAVGTFLDVMIASFATYTIATMSGLREENPS
ncbi:MAG: cation:dicarboxylase symporter family transporter [Spirochaetaceae bacterium]|jgi:Na+/H+-dicarboxylate symporter|nr:cation:dicarboxylase symporter family transporter [Spirochaetaceae bacterium]